MRIQRSNNFYLELIVINGLLIGFDIFITKSVYNILKGKPEFIAFFILISVPILLLALFFSYYRFKKAQEILFENNILFFGNKAISLKDIISLSFNNILESQYLYFREGISIELDDGTKIDLPDRFYKKLDELKVVLDKKINGKTDDNYQLTDTVFNDSSDKDIFKILGRFYLLNHILMFFIYFPLILGLIIIWNIFDNSIVIFILYLLILFIFFFFFNLIYHYLTFTEVSIKIQNHLIFWKKHSIYIDDIKEVVIEYPNIRSHLIRIVFILKNFTKISYFYVTYGKKEIEELTRFLETKKKNYRNDTF